MAKYIELERALALIKPDAPEDEKAAITITTAKNSFGIFWIVHRPLMSRQWCMGDGYR